MIFSEMARDGSIGCADAGGAPGGLRCASFLSTPYGDRGSGEYWQVPTRCADNGDTSQIPRQATISRRRTAYWQGVLKDGLTKTMVVAERFSRQNGACLLRGIRHFLLD